jgi:site-specific recombinase XerD
MGVNFNLVRPKARVSSIRVKVSVSGAAIFLYTGRSIETVHWDKRKCFVKSYPGQNTTNRLVRHLKNLEMSILDALDEYKNGTPRPTFLEFQEKLNLLIDNPRTKFNVTTHKSAGSTESLLEFLDYFINDCKTGVRLSPKRQIIKPSSLATYITSRSYINKFEQQASRQLFLTDFNQKDIDQISDFLIINCELAMNTHAKIMMDLLQIIKYAVHLKKLPSSRLIELKFDTRREETDSIYLTEAEILEILAVRDFKDAVEEHVRDVFVIGCFTAMRFSDYSTLDVNSIRNNRLEFVQQKTGAKVTIPIHPTVRQILEKYNYALPEVPPNNEFNRIIKLVGERLPSLHVPFIKQITYKRERKQVKMMKYEFLQTHTARRSFCSNEYLRGTDPMVIMAMSGHSSHKSFMRYIKVTNEQFADKLEQIWADRKQ